MLVLGSGTGGSTSDASSSVRAGVRVTGGAISRGIGDSASSARTGVSASVRRVPSSSGTSGVVGTANARSALVYDKSARLPQV